MKKPERSLWRCLKRISGRDEASRGWAVNRRRASRAQALAKSEIASQRRGAESHAGGFGKFFEEQRDELGLSPGAGLSNTDLRRARSVSYMPPSACEIRQ